MMPTSSNSGPLEAILGRLKDVKERGGDQGGYLALCPAHDDRKHSLAVSSGDRGVVLNCFAGCQLETILGLIGIEKKDLFYDQKPRVTLSLGKGKTYVYRDETGAPVYKIKRTRSKAFYPYVWDAEASRWSTKAGYQGVEKIPYRLDEIAKSPEGELVFWVEGERDADTLAGLGFLATTSPGGVNGFDKRLASYLEDRRVVVIPDNDEPGRKYASTVAQALFWPTESVKVLDLPGLPDKGDVTDWFLYFNGTNEEARESLLSLAEGAPEVKADTIRGGGEKATEDATETPKRSAPKDHAGLRDLWSEEHPYTRFSRGEWMQCQAGYWAPIDELKVKAQVVRVLEELESVKITSSMVSSVLSLCQIDSFVDGETWDRDPNLLVFPNGTLDITTRELREHRPENFITSSLPYEYDPDARALTFLQVLEDTIPEAAAFLQEYAGYCLTPSTEHELALWFQGPRGCGKSSIIEGLVAMLGESKHGVLGLAELEASIFALSKVPGKTLLTSTEQPNAYLKSTHYVDALISGEKLRIERKYREAEDVTPVAKIIWAMNDAPRIGNTTAGIFRRVQIVPFPELGKEPDTTLKRKIRAEAAGILNWALDGRVELEDRGAFEIPACVQAATTEWELSNDLPALFLEEECVVGPGLEVASSLLYSRYDDWCQRNNYKALGAARMNKEWERLGFKKRTLKGRKYWQGLEVRSGIIL